MLLLLCRQTGVSCLRPNSRRFRTSGRRVRFVRYTHGKNSRPAASQKVFNKDIPSTRILQKWKSSAIWRLDCESYGRRCWHVLMFKNSNVFVSGDLQNEESVLEWLIDDDNRELADEIEEVNSRMLERLLDESLLLAVFFCKYNSRPVLIIRDQRKIKNRWHKLYLYIVNRRGKLRRMRRYSRGVRNHWRRSWFVRYRHGQNIRSRRRVQVQYHKLAVFGVLQEKSAGSIWR